VRTETRVLVTGAGGFIGHYLVNYLKEHGYWVRGVDIKPPEFHASSADEFELLVCANRKAASRHRGELTRYMRSRRIWVVWVIYRRITRGYYITTR
jgi:nucleoside-diphosphate-sugar epimerase